MVVIKSLMSMGTPAKGASGSTLAAIARAMASRGRTTALSRGLRAAMRASAASVTSAALRARRRTRSAMASPSSPSYSGRGRDMRETTAPAEDYGRKRVRSSALGSRQAGAAISKRRRAIRSYTASRSGLGTNRPIAAATAHTPPRWATAARAAALRTRTDGPVGSYHTTESTPISSGNWARTRLPNGPCSGANARCARAAAGSCRSTNCTLPAQNPQSPSYKSTDREAPGKTEPGVSVALAMPAS